MGSRLTKAVDCTVFSDCLVSLSTIGLCHKNKLNFCLSMCVAKDYSGWAILAIWNWVYWKWHFGRKISLGQMKIIYSEFCALEKQIPFSDTWLSNVFIIKNIYYYKTE